MYPILYKSNETNFVHNGIGLLRDAITVYPEEELNGYSEITIEYDADGFLADEIKNGMIIKAKANDKQQPQLFRIYSHVKDHSADQIIINGRHITNDLADNFVEALEIRNMTTYQAMKAIQERLAYPTRFNFSSTNTTTTSSTNIYRNNPLQMVAGTEGSILQHWGGQIERDNFDLIMHRRRGSDDGVKVLYKKNLTGLQATFDDDSVVTRIYPFKYVEETEEERARLITVPGKYIDSPNIDKYPHIKILPIDASSEEGIENSTDLYNAYKDYFSNEGKDKDLPSVSMEVEFEHLWETEEYKDVAALEHVGLGDTITVGHTKWGLDLKATIVKIEYDSITEKNRKVSAGNVKANFTDSVNQNANDLGVIGENMNKIDQKTNEAIRAANGKNTIYYGPDEPTGDHLIKGDMWFRIVDGEYTRTYIYDGVQWQLSIDMESKEAKETAAEARNRAEEAVGKADLATSNAIEAINQAQEAFDNAENLSKVVDENTEDISEISQIAQGLQTRVSDAEGNISTVTQLATALQSRMTNAEGSISTLTQTASSLQSTIKGVRDDLDGLEIGGRNFLQDSEDERTGTTFDYDLNDSSLSPGDIVTLSFDVESNSDAEIQYYFRQGTSGNDVRSIQLNAGKSRYQMTFKVPDYIGGTHFRIRSQTGSLSIKRAQLEKGNKATDWKPAPEDMATQSQISQLSDNINLRVQKNDIINQINISTEDILISGKKLILDGDTTVNGSFRVENANITSLNAGKITAGTLDAGKLNVINVSANSIVSGLLQSQNSNTTFNLNTGNLTMRNANFTLGNGARIEFTSVGNRIQYSDVKDGTIRSAGFGVGKSLQDYPFAYSGTTGAANLDTLSEYYSGAMWHTTRAIADGASNSISGFRFQLRNKAVNWDKGIEIDFNGTPTIRPMAHGTYDIGLSNYRFRRIYADNILGWRTVYISNPTANRGFAIDTDHVDGHNPSIYGQYPANNNYNIGRSDRYMTYVYTNSVRANYLHGALQGNSARKFKKNEGVMHLEDSLEFIRNAKIVTFDWRRDETMKFNKDNPQTIYDRQVGFIIDDLQMRNDYLVKSDEETIKKDNILFMHQHVIQSNLQTLTRHETELDRLRKQNEELVFKVAELEQRLHNMEVAG